VVFPHTGVIACQGIEGSNSQAAADKLFPRGNIVYVKSFEAAFNAVESGLCQFAVLPIENSTNGSVRAVYNLLQKKRFSIVRGTSLCIRHELMAKPGTKTADITEIFSHEQALGQCGRWLATLSGKVKITPCANTALAAKMVAESADPGAAAICSHACAELYGLETLSGDIQDSDNNYTRFICVTKKPAIYAGANRISLILACQNKPGALNEILTKLAAHGVNMSKLESCPVTGGNFEFEFFMELDASVRETGRTAAFGGAGAHQRVVPLSGQLLHGVSRGQPYLRAAWPLAQAQPFRFHPPRTGKRVLPPVELEPEELGAFLRRDDIGGLNVTIPYKRDVIPFCDALDETAHTVGSVNTIVRDSSGKLVGYNTDVYGLACMAERAGISFAGRKVVVFGSGGASLTAQYAAKQGGAKEVVVISRKGSNTYETLSRHADADLLVNATPSACTRTTARCQPTPRIFPRARVCWSSCTIRSAPR
jgi:prephenate dehydratase